MIQDERLEVGGRIILRPMRDDYCDGLVVSKWRNLYRANYFTPSIVTPSSHWAWMQQRQPGDEVWMVLLKDNYRMPGMYAYQPVGMTSLTIHPGTLTAEYGRTLVDPRFQGLGLGCEIEWTAMAVGFDLFKCEMLDGELLPENAAIAHVHDKIGWRRVGINVEGHCHPGVDVLYIQMTAAEWQGSRIAFAAWLQEHCNLELHTSEW